MESVVSPDIDMVDFLRVSVGNLDGEYGVHIRFVCPTSGCDEVGHSLFLPMPEDGSHGENMAEIVSYLPNVITGLTGDLHGRFDLKGWDFLGGGYSKIN